MYGGSYRTIESTDLQKYLQIQGEKTTVRLTGGTATGKEVLHSLQEKIELSKVKF